jgi:signal transduction histidine kinase
LVAVATRSLVRSKDGRRDPQAVVHSERLIEGLLVLARNDQARTLIEPLDLAAVSEDALEGRTANGITTTIALHEAPVTGDGVLLERLVANLLSNAERYNIAGGTVTISTGTDNRASVVRVANTGPLVPPDQVDRLFLPFTRLDDRTRHDGFGLGLTLVSSIAAVHGGTVEATAMPTGGLDISVRLPQREDAVDNRRRTTEVANPRGPAGARGEPRRFSRRPD